MNMKPLHRRTVLRGLLAGGTAVTIPLPLLNAMLNESGTALAQTATPLSPLYVTWFFGNGVLPGRWKPAKTGMDDTWALSDQLAPFAALKQYLTVISGLTSKVPPNGLPHPWGSASCTTGAGISGVAVRAPSIDQLVADVISTGAPFRSLEVGVTPATPNGPQHSLASVSHKGPNARNNPEFDPKAVFTRLFSGGTTGGTTTPTVDQAAKLLKVKTSVLDSTLADGANLQKRLGAADKQRLEQHLESIRAIEKRLQSTGTTTPPTTSACGTAKQPTVAKDAKSEAPPAVNTAMTELVTLALACEKTRVVTYMFSLPAAHVYYRHLGADMDDDFHDTICHGDAGDQSSQTRVHTGVMYTMRCANEFLQKMKDTPHGAGNLLDASLIYMTSENSWGKTHTFTEWPVVLAGKAGGKLRGNQHLNFPSENLSKVLFTIAKMMGSTKTELGLDEGRVTAALTGLG
jgi:hypothetical protein